MIARRVQEVYGNSYVVSIGIADFLMHLLDDDDAIVLANEETQLMDANEKAYVNHFALFTIIALYYLRAMVTTHLFEGLASRVLSKRTSQCKFYGISLMYKLRIRLFHVSPSSYDTPLKLKKACGAEEKRLKEFFAANFSTMLADEQHFMLQSFIRNHTLYIIGFENGGKTNHIIAAIMYVSCAEGTYINWFAVSLGSFDKKTCGRFANNKPFRSTGLGSFLLQMVQLQAVARGYKPDLYLQANMSAEAATYYEHRGFVKMDANDPKQLPETLQYFYKKSKNDSTYEGPYVNFVTNEQLRRDAISRQDDPDAPETQQEFLHLYALTGMLKTTRVSSDVETVDRQVQSCLPQGSDTSSIFLRFPFSELKSVLNNATEELLLLDHHWFKFTCAKYDDIREDKDGVLFGNSAVTVQTYMNISEDVKTDQFRYWLNDEVLDFFFCWMMRNEDTPVVQATEIVPTMVTKAVQDFFYTDRTKAVLAS